MGYDYLLFHVYFTIPPAVALTALLRPLATRLDGYMTCFLITIAIVSTTPWDSYLIRAKIWSYPPDAVLGLTLFRIPIEEVFFFFIQTYCTSLLYLLVSKASFQPGYLPRNANQARRSKLLVGLFSSTTALGLAIVFRQNAELSISPRWTYLGLILAWVSPFLTLLSYLSGDFIERLKPSNVIVPIFVPTMYLWITDTLALKRGTWAINTATKLDVYLWPGLEIEEAVFFLVTNVLIVFGLAAFHHAASILHAFPDRFPTVPNYPSAVLLIEALVVPFTEAEYGRVRDLQDATVRLKEKSRSFSLASGAFSGRLRLDLVCLYSYCRMADDLIDNAENAVEAREWIDRLRRFLDLRFDNNVSSDSSDKLEAYIAQQFPSKAQSALRVLPSTHLSKGPLYDLLFGFEMDLEFDTTSATDNSPIRTEVDLLRYGNLVAGTVGHLCVDLIFHHYASQAGDSAQRAEIYAASERAGTALQYVNIARDIEQDAKIGRCYLPLSWLDHVGLSYEAVLKEPNSAAVAKLRRRLLERAFELYGDSKGQIEMLPVEARVPVRVSTESYMEIGRVLQESGAKWQVREGRASVPKWRRFWAAWKALNYR